MAMIIESLNTMTKIDKSIMLVKEILITLCAPKTSNK